jgi:hypothetical protein
MYSTHVSEDPSEPSLAVEDDLPPSERGLADWTRVLGPLHRAPFLAMCREDARRSTCTALEAELVELIDGWSTLAEIAERSEKGDLAFQSLASLRTRGVIAMRSDESGR